LQAMPLARCNAGPVSL